MEIISTIGRLVNRNDIIGAWCFQILQCAVVQAFKRFGEQCLDKSYSHGHCVITLTQTFCDIPDKVSEWDILSGHTWKVAGRWWGKAPVYEEGKKTPVRYEDLEFDVVAEDQNDKNTILVGECKWKGADYADRLLDKLKKKVNVAPFAQGKKVVYALFLREQPLSDADCDILLPDDVILQLPE